MPTFSIYWRLEYEGDSRDADKNTYILIHKLYRALKVYESAMKNEAKLTAAMKVQFGVNRVLDQLT